MSMATLLLQLLFALLGFVLSLKGVFALLLGVVAFIAMPIVPKATGEFKSLANFHLWLAVTMLGRIAIVVSEHGDLLLKRMSFDDLGVEKISFGNDVKEFEDPASALHYWMDIPFALADEVHGVLFDPRHAALGQRKADSDERGETTIPATQAEWNTYGVHEWKKGVFEMPKKFELVTLSAVRHLVDGGERAEYPKRVEELYKHSRAPFDSGTSATRFIMIIVALLGPFAAMWLMATQGPSTGGSGGSVVGYGQSILVLAISAASAGELLKDIDWKRAGKIMAIVLPAPILFLLLAVFVSPLTALFTFIVFSMGFILLPLFSILARASDRLSVSLARMLFKTGLLGWDRPVLEWTPQKYQLREYSELDTTDDVKWYGLAGSLFGFTFTPGEESWGAEVVDKNELESRKEIVADGGSPANSNIPAGWTRVPAMKRASSYAGFVPSRLKDSKYYLNTGIALGRFRDSANGERALNRLLSAKEKHGRGGGLSDKSIVYAMVGCGVFSTALGVFVFFL